MVRDAREPLIDGYYTHYLLNLGNSIGQSVRNTSIPHRRQSALDAGVSVAIESGQFVHAEIASVCGHDTIVKLLEQGFAPQA